MAKDYDDTKVRKSGLTQREEETLPVWAQERIAGLRSEKGELEDAVTEMKPTEEPTSVVVGDVRRAVPHYLPDERFDYVHLQVSGEEKGNPESGDWLAVARKEDASGPYLEVSVKDGELAFRPQALNVVRVYAVHDEDVADDTKS